VPVAICRNKTAGFASKSKIGVNAGKSYSKGRLSTVDLLVLTSLEQLVFALKLLFLIVTKQATLMRR
jgi:hypothetical protein